MNQENEFRISKDDYFMKIAVVVSERSTCIKRKVGAVLIKDSYILSTGYNGSPSGLDLIIALQKHVCDRTYKVVKSQNYAGEFMPK